MSSPRKRRSSRVSGEAHAKRPRPGPVTPLSPPVGPSLHPCLQGQPGGRHYTVSIALPGSVLLKQQTLDLKTRLASRIARAAAIFRADEVVIFDETASLPSVRGSSGRLVDLERALSDFTSEPAVHLALMLQYLECPQYLRRHFFPVHPALAKTGLMDPLALPSHVARDEETPYREGVVLSRNKEQTTVDVGLATPITMASGAPVGARVTVRMPRRPHGEPRVVAPSRPRRKGGIYWGFQVRLVNGLSGVLHGCPFVGEESESFEENEEETDGSSDENKAPSGYDLVIGTSERGTPIEHYEMPQFRHLLIVFGGPEGLELSLELDETLLQTDVRHFFPTYLNTCSGQGSRTIRTEEAILVTMAALDQQIRLKGLT